MFSTSTFNERYEGDYNGIKVGDFVEITDGASDLCGRFGIVKKLEYGEILVQLEDSWKNKWVPIPALSIPLCENNISFETTIKQII